jgi:hypothetical protein
MTSLLTTACEMSRIYLLVTSNTEHFIAFRVSSVIFTLHLPSCDQASYKGFFL